MTKQEIKDFLLIEFTVIAPLKDIVKNLEANIYRDSDHGFLKDQLNYFTDMAVKSTKMDFDVKKYVDAESSDVLNESTRNKYLKYFKTLLEFFKEVNK